MKKLLTAMSIVLGLGLASAQQVAPATKPVQQVAPATKPLPAKTVTKQKPAIAEGTKAPKPEQKLKKDGTPDKRYKENKKLKKDGTPDKRYKVNK